MKNLSPEYLGWRTLPGLLGRHASSPQSVHALLGYFLKDRKSPTPFPGRDMLANEGVFDWGLARPLEKVIESEDHLHVLLGMPEIYRQSVAVVEPWASVGTNPRGEPVRASKNIAYICQQVADADTILFPVWQSGIRNPERLANVLSAGIATIVQGGCPSVHDATSFEGASAGLDDMLALVDQLLLRRSTASGPSIFICLGHQLAAASHVRLLQRAVREIGKLPRLPLDQSGRVLNSLQRAAERIARMGDQLQVVKQGQPRAIGWNDPDFAVAGNENVEVGTRTLLPYVRRDDETHIPRELHEMHALVADELEGVIDQALTLEREITVEMFHADEVNEEAALFANWAYKTLHDTIVPLRHVLAVSPRRVAAQPAVRGGNPRPDPGRRPQLDRGRHHGHLLQGLGNPSRAPLVHVPVPSGTDGRHPRHRRPRRAPLSGTQGSRRRATADPPALSRNAGVNRLH